MFVHTDTLPGLNRLHASVSPYQCLILSLLLRRNCVRWQDDEYLLRAVEDAFRVGDSRYTFDIPDPPSAFFESVAKLICIRYICVFDDEQAATVRRCYKTAYWGAKPQFTVPHITTPMSFKDYCS